VPLDRGQHPVGQHDLVGAQLGAGQERQQPVAPVLRRAEREHLASKDIVGADESEDLLAHGRGRGPGRRHDLQVTPVLAVVLLRALHR
jgi:hypothetical protein